MTESGQEFRGLNTGGDTGWISVIPEIDRTEAAAMEPFQDAGADKPMVTSNRPRHLEKLESAMTLRILTALAVGLSIAADDPDKRVTGGEKGELQGEWTIARHIYDGYDLRTEETGEVDL